MDQSVLGRISILNNHDYDFNKPGARPSLVSSVLTNAVWKGVKTRERKGFSSAVQHHNSHKDLVPDTHPTVILFHILFSNEDIETLIYNPFDQPY